MSFFRKITSLISSPKEKSGDVYWLYVRCKRCGEPIGTRINLNTDLSANFGEGESETTYFCRKVLMGEGRCFQRVEVELTFDQDRNLIDRQIAGGEFISEEEYSAERP